MKLLFIEGVWTNEVTRALSWTLLHSLWQGLALAIVAALVILATKRSKAVIRYNLFTGIFFLFLLCTVCTFIWQLDRTKNIKETTGQHINLVDNSTISSTVLEDSKQQKTFSQKFTTRLINYCNAQAPLIVAIWLFVFIVKMVKILSGFGYVQKIRHRKTHPADVFWNKRIAELRQRLMIAKEVLLLQSELIKIPVVIGYFKPVILVPMGLLSQLPPEQVEAVLLHELAHIRRKDYLVNLVQSFAETVFFFNPALLWISELVREERENCCDDIAIGEVENKNEFIHALVAFQEYNYNNMNARIAFAGTKNHLLNRVKRIVYNENKKLNAMEKSIFILTIVTASLLATVSFKELPAQQVRKSEIRADQTQKTIDTVPSKEFSSFNSTLNDDGKTKTLRIDAKKDGKVYRLEKQNDKLTAFYLDGKKVPTDQLDSHKDIIGEIEYMHDLRIKESTERVEESRSRIREQERAIDGKRRIQEKGQKERLERLNEIEKVKRTLTEVKLKTIEKNKQEALENLKLQQEDQIKLREEMMEKLKEQAADNTKKTKEIRDKYTKEYTEKMKLIEKDRTDQLRKINSLQAKDYKLRKEMIQKLQKGQTDNLRKMKTIEDQSRKLYLDKLKRYDLNRTEQLNRLQELRVDQQKLLSEKNAQLRQMRLNEEKAKTLFRNQERLLRQERLTSSLEPIISDLKEEKLLDNSDNFSFELNNEELIVNGKKQSKEIHDRYKKKYITNPKNQYKFSQNGNTRNSTVIEN